MVTYDEIARMIDHSLLKPTLTDEEIEEGCELAAKYRVASVCVRPSDVRLAKELLNGTGVLVTTVIGFPHGTTTTGAKVAEANEAIDNGAAELDMVLNIGKLKSRNLEYVRHDIKAVTDAAHRRNVLVKVIFENCFLSEQEIIAACRICNDAGADFAKTSTGYGTGGAEDKDIKLMRKYCDDRIQIKAAGGVRTLERAIEIKALGCTRFGCTATVGILERLK